MWLKNKKANLLEKSVDNLNNNLQQANFLEWSYILRQ